MANSYISQEELYAALAAYREAGTIKKAADLLGIHRESFRRRLRAAAKQGLTSSTAYQEPEYTHKPFEVEDLPSPLPTVEELLARRKEEFTRVDAAKRARKLIDVKINLDGPIGIAHMGDTHLDDPGTDIGLVEHHVGIINRTEGLFGANVGDNANHWVGRLARLYGEQSTSAKESWVLVEWLLTSVQFLYLVAGNHDLFVGPGDPVEWIMRCQPGSLYEAHGARLNLKFPNGCEVRVNARHDFVGASQWNPAHGPSKAAQSGWRDQILTCGHKHITGYAPIKDPASGLISHAIRVASYKTHDRYADEKGLPDQNFSACVATIIDPYATNPANLVTVFFDLAEAAEFLTWKRHKFKQGKR